MTRTIFSRRQLHSFWLFMTLWLALAPAAIAQAPLTAEVDRAGLSSDEYLTLTVTVRSDALNPPDPVLPPFAGFEVLGRSTSSQISMLNTKISAEAITTYRLHPTQTGELTIGAISVEIDGQTYTTEPITVQVSAGSAPPASTAPDSGQPPVSAPATLSGQDFFVEAAVDNPTPYVGQQIVYRFRFYQAIELFNQPQYQAPTFTGFWNQQQPDQTQYTTQAANRPYRVTELRVLLYPTTAGEITIEPARLTIPGDFFSPGVELKTEPVTVQVQSLPPNAPVDFNGAVGQFEIAATVGPAQVKVNEPVTLRVKLTGAGNIEKLPPPVWPELPGWRSFESKAVTTTSDQIGGSSEYERLMVPGSPGQFTIPAIRYTYFDPATGQYQTIQTAPLPVSVSPAEAQPPVPAVSGSGKEAVTQIAGDIRHIKPAPPALKSAGKALTLYPVYWLLWLLPLLGLAGNFVWLKQRDYLRRNTALARRSRAYRNAQKLLQQAQKQAESPYSAAGRILTAYLSDKLNRAVSGMTRPELAAQLQSAGVADALIARVQSVLAQSDLGRFAPANSALSDQRLLPDTRQLIDDLEKAFR